MSVKVPRAMLAKILGLTVHAVSRLEREGLIRAVAPPRRGVPSRYDLTIVVPAYLATLRAGESARERRDRSLAELNELRLAERRGALVSRERVIHEGQAVLRAVRARLLLLPRRLVQLGLVSLAEEAAARELVVEALAELAAWRLASAPPEVAPDTPAAVSA